MTFWLTDSSCLLIGEPRWRTWIDDNGAWIHT